MRIYQTFSEAHSEVKRDLAEMGIRVHPKSYQDKDIADREEFSTLELQNYIYTVTQPELDDIPVPSQVYVKEEWRDRMLGIIGRGKNPGESWKERPEVWKQFLEEDGKFSYTYSERLDRVADVRAVIEEIKDNPDSRQLYIPIWEPEDIENLGGKRRIPCSLGYHVMVRGTHGSKQLNLTYLQRSADFVTHFANDMWLSHRLQIYLADKTGYPVGNFTHWVGSLHVFQKDVEGVF